MVRRADNELLGKVERHGLSWTSATTATRANLHLENPEYNHSQKGAAMTPQDLYAIIGSNLVAIAAVGGLVATFFWRTAARLDRRIDNDKAAADADRRTFQAAADAHRRAFQAGMDDFKKEMQRLAERQSRIEGRADAGPVAAD